MKKLFLLTALLFSTTSFAHQLDSYEQVKAAILEGKSIHIVTDFTHCTHSENKTINANYVATYSPREIMINNEQGYISASLLHFTLNDPKFLSKPVYGFATYKFTHDGMMSLSFQTLDAVSFAALNAPTTFVCSMNSGAKVYV